MNYRFLPALRHRFFSLFVVLLFSTIFLSAQTKGKPLSYLRAYIGMSPYNLWKTQPLHRRLVALLGAKEYESFVGNLDPATPLTLQDGVLYLTGNAPHRGGEEEAVLLVDIENDTLEVLIRHKETIVLAWAENHRTVRVPHDAMEVIQRWPHAAVSQALGSLRQADGAQNTPASSRNVSSPTMVSGTQSGSVQRTAFVATPKICPAGTPCDEVNSFAATITDFRTSNSDRYKVITATLHITNKLNRPLILGLVQNAAVGIDDQGNRYGIANANNVRGIGLISSSFDPKFTLQPGESGDARVEMLFQQQSNVIYGTSWEVDLTLREADPVGVGQYRMGLEHALRFANLVNRLSARPPSGIVTGNFDAVGNGAYGGIPNSSGSAAVIPAALPDACAGAPRCYSAGPFVATIASVNASQVGNFKDHVLRMDIKFHNVTSRPIILAYAAATSTAIDNLGNSYFWGHAGTHDGSVQGIGMAESQKADPRFILQPGETRNATFQVVRYRPGNAQLGTSFTYSVTIQQLEILPSQQIRTTRDYSMNFRDLTASGFSGQGISDSIRKFGDIFKKR
jgi:hypothetical protein